MNNPKDKTTAEVVPVTTEYDPATEYDISTLEFMCSGARVGMLYGAAADYVRSAIAATPKVTMEESITMMRLAAWGTESKTDMTVQVSIMQDAADALRDAGVLNVRE